MGIRKFTNIILIFASTLIVGTIILSVIGIEFVFQKLSKWAKIWN